LVVAVDKLKHIMESKQHNFFPELSVSILYLVVYIMHFLYLTMFNSRLLDEGCGFVSLRRQCHSILLFVCAEPGERQAVSCGTGSENGWNSDPTRLCAAMTHQHIRAEVYMTEKTLLFIINITNM
jgi:hypothetical protein